MRTPVPSTPCNLRASWGSEPDRENRRRPRGRLTAPSPLGRRRRVRGLPRRRSQRVDGARRVAERRRSRSPRAGSHLRAQRPCAPRRDAAAHVQSAPLTGRRKRPEALVSRTHGSSSTTPSSAGSSRRSSRCASSPSSLQRPAEVTEQLARVYGSLGWRAERMRAVKDLTARFPDDLRRARALPRRARGGRRAHRSRQGRRADQAARSPTPRSISIAPSHGATGKRRSPSSTARQKRRPDRKEIAGRIADVLARSGDPSAAAAQLEKALAKNPAGRAGALSPRRPRVREGRHIRAPARARRGAPGRTRRAPRSARRVDLIEGASLLEPYRIDGRKVIREFEAVGEVRQAHGGQRRAHPRLRGDLGSPRRLERDARARDSSRMQSQEAVDKEAEQSRPTGLVLRLRVIKPDGSILEPEPVAGKPTLTMPHLEVGDYFEIEHITPEPERRQKGAPLPRAALVLPRSRQGLLAERVRRHRAEGPAARDRDRRQRVRAEERAPGTFVERRWRVDESPPAPEEPDSPNPREFLPSVRVGWGINLDDTLARFVDAASEETPLDPRCPASPTKSCAASRRRRRTNGRGGSTSWVGRARPRREGERRTARRVRESGIAAGRVPLPPAPARDPGRARAREEPHRDARRSGR